MTTPNEEIDMVFTFEVAIVIGPLDVDPHSISRLNKSGSTTLTHFAIHIKGKNSVGRIGIDAITLKKEIQSLILFLSNIFLWNIKKNCFVEGFLNQCVRGFEAGNISGNDLNASQRSDFAKKMPILAKFLPASTRSVPPGIHFALLLLLVLVLVLLGRPLVKLGNISANS
jgi:hypothetical protein